MGSNQQNLYEISYFRPFIILMIVVMHSFLKILTGGGYVSKFTEPEAYRWIFTLIMGFGLEAAVFIAGYLFAYQSLELHREYTFKEFSAKKAKRLIIQLLIFSSLYFFCFDIHNTDFDFITALLYIASGCGHLWFLPMLFWCYICIWYIDKKKYSSLTLLIILLLCSVIQYKILFLGLGRLPHFLFYMYLGYYFREHNVLSSRTFNNKKTTILSIILYLTLVCVSRYSETILFAETSLFEKGLKKLVNETIQLGLSCSGISVLSILFYNHVHRYNFKPSKLVLQANKSCYGVYIVHQFILIYLYHLTPLVQNAGLVWSPIIGFSVAITVSILLTQLMLRTKVGSILIG